MFDIGIDLDPSELIDCNALINNLCIFTRDKDHLIDQMLVHCEPVYDNSWVSII